MILCKSLIQIIKQEFASRNNNSNNILIIFITIFCLSTRAVAFFPRSSSFGYLAALAMPLNLSHHNAYMAFNFEANYGLPSNDFYHRLIDKLNSESEKADVERNVTTINGRSFNKKTTQLKSPRYNRLNFYQTFVKYLNYFDYNGTACLLRSICEVASYKWEENNGIFGSILKILFTPTSSKAEDLPQQHYQILGLNNHQALYQAEGLASPRHNNQNNNIFVDNCTEYRRHCPEGVINMISKYY